MYTYMMRGACKRHYICRVCVQSKFSLYNLTSPTPARAEIPCVLFAPSWPPVATSCMVQLLLLPSPHIIAFCGADCQPHIRLFACSAWLLTPPPPSLLPSHLHSYKTVITLNLSNLWYNPKSPRLHKPFSLLSFLYA